LLLTRKGEASVSRENRVRLISPIIGIDGRTYGGRWKEKME
jgi:hypothetical protein